MVYKKRKGPTPRSQSVYKMEKTITQEILIE